MNLPQVRSLGYLGIGVSDLPAWENFATDVLGYQLGAVLDDKTRLVRIDEYSRRFLLRPTGEDDVIFAGWELANGAALDQMEARLKGLGIAVRRSTTAEERTRGVTAFIACTDPNGMQTELYFGPKIEAECPFVPSQAIAGFKTGVQGLGHFVLMVDDLELSDRFSREALGLTITDYIHLDLGPAFRTTATFYHCNPRHHSVAIVKAPFPRRLLHFMTEAGTLDEVGLAMERARKGGIKIAADLGRHTNDRMVSFYMVSPSGFEVEYGFGGRHVDDATWRVEQHDKGEIWGHRRI